MNTIKTIEFPFGIDVDTLIVCHNDTHRRYVFEAFGLKARYGIWGQSLMGSQFKKIIAFTPVHVTQRDEDYMNTNLKTKLTRTGMFYLV